AGLALEQLGSINEYISAVQIGVTMTSVGVGALGEPALAAILKSVFPSSVSHGIATAVAVIVAYSVITITQLIAGEMVPKFYAIDRAELVARRVAAPLQAFFALFRPLIRGLTALAVGILSLFGVDMTAE